MKYSNKKYWAGPIILILTISVIVYLFFFSSYGEQIDSNVVIGSLVALMGLLGVTFQIKATQEIDAERREHELQLNHRNALSQIKMRSYDARKESYQQLLQPFMESLILQRKQEEIDFQKDVDKMMRANIEIHLLGSDETCRTWQKFRNISLSIEGKCEEIKRKKMLTLIILFAKLILSIRRDLGHPYTEIEEFDILRSFINDFDKYEKDFEQALLSMEKKES